MMCRAMGTGDSGDRGGRSILGDERMARAVRAVCGSGVIDRESLKRGSGLIGSDVEIVLGALISSGYLVKVAPCPKLCGSCPGSNRCGRLSGGGGAGVYVASEKLRRLCRDVARE